jgi:ferrochelatase
MEVIYDLDRVAAATAAERGMRLVRSATPGTDSRFVDMVVDLLQEADGCRDRSWLGEMGPAPFPCVPGCCPPPVSYRAGPAPVGPVDLPR